MDKLPKLDAKWKKPDTKDHILYDSIYRQCPEKAKFIETENRSVIAENRSVIARG